MIQVLEQFDKDLLLYINSLNSPFFDTVMWIISGVATWMPLYALLLFFAIKNNRKQWWLIVIAIALVVTLADQISLHLFKELIKRYRPSHNLDLAGMLHHVNGYIGGKHGFVSSHAANSFAIAGLFSFIFKNRYVTISLLFWASLVSYSRMYLGVHYPSDIICGGLLGLLIAWGVNALYNWGLKFTR